MTIHSNPLGPIDHAIALIGDTVASGAQLKRAEKVYRELIDFRSRTTVVEEDNMSEQLETQGQGEQEVISDPVEETTGVETTETDTTEEQVTT